MNSRAYDFLADQAVFNINSLINCRCDLKDVQILEQINKDGKEIITTISSWINGEGAEFKLQMDFRYDPSCPGKIWADYRSQPSIVNGQVIDEYGFKLPSYRYRRLGWDLLMQLDTQTLEEKVSKLNSKVH